MRGLLMAVLLGPGVAVAAAPVDGIVQCMTANLPQSLRVQSVEMTTWDRAGGERVMQGRVFGTREKDRGRVMARVESPQDLAGTAFLVREAEAGAEMYVFMPSVNRVKRMAASTMNGKLWGSDFSYNEFRQVWNAFGGTAAVLAGAAEFERRPVHVLVLTPPADEPALYDSIRVLVDQRTCVPLQAEFRKKDAVRKLLSAPAASLRQAAGQWYSAELTLRDLVEGTRTRLRVVGVSPGRLSASHFHPQQFHSVR